MSIIKKATIPVYKSIKKVLDTTGIKIPQSLKKINKKVLKSLRSQSVEIDGNTFYLDEADSLLLSVNGVYEEFETELVKKLVKKGDVVFDIGANIGYYTLQFAKLVGETGKVYAFEPDPINFELLKKNVETNGYSNVVLVQKAVSDKNKTLKLYINETNRGDNRAYDSNDGRTAVSIESVALDDYFSSNTHVDFIKMDIQGFENEALQGMKNVLSNNKNITLISEFWPVGIYRSGGNAQEYLDVLNQNKFSISEIKEDKKTVQEVSDLNSLMVKYTIANELYTNLLCIKSE